MNVSRRNRIGQLALSKKFNWDSLDKIGIGLKVSAMSWFVLSKPTYLLAEFLYKFNRLQHIAVARQ